MRRAALALLLLAACAREAAPPVAPASFRDAGAPIGSTTRGGPADLEGEWVVSQAFPGSLGVVPGAGVRVGAGGWSVSPPGGAGRTLALAPSGPGRYAGAAELWVLWVDDDFRTAAVGTPDGSFGWIMDRPGEASPDRTTAAREMLDFNGYDLGRLRGG